MALETFGDIINEVLQFGFNDGPQVNRGRIASWVNEGQKQIARQVEAPEFQEKFSFKMTVGQFEYALPERFARMQDIKYPFLNTRLRWWDIQDYDMVSNEVLGPPALYTIWKEKLLIFPSPNSEDELVLRYQITPPVLTNEAEVPLLNTDYLHLLVGYAKVRAFEAEDDFEAAAQHKGRYKEDLDAYASDVQLRQVDRPRQIDGTWLGSSYGSRGVM